MTSFRLLSLGRFVTQEITGVEAVLSDPWLPGNPQEWVMAAKPPEPYSPRVDVCVDSGSGGTGTQEMGSSAGDELGSG